MSRTGQFVLHLSCHLLRCYNGYWLLFLFFFYIVKLVTYILFYLVDFCTTIIGEINMINNNVDEHPIPPIWRHEKLISEN